MCLAIANYCLYDGSNPGWSMAALSRNNIRAKTPAQVQVRIADLADRKNATLTTDFGQDLTLHAPRRSYLAPNRWVMSAVAPVSHRAPSAGQPHVWRTRAISKLSPRRARHAVRCVTDECATRAKIVSDA